MPIRYDSSRLDAAQIRRDARGFVRVPAIIAKPGVYSYTQDGKTVREYLPPEEVARADSLASVQDAPVTIRHPRNMVDSATWGSVSIGHASGPAKATADGARAELVIARKDAQDMIGTELVEVSRGVQVRIDETPGVTPDGQAYDRVQRDIVYNHVALGPRGWGRQGASVSLRLDSNGDEQITETMKYTDKTGKVHEFKTDSELQTFLDSRTDGEMPPAFLKNAKKKKGAPEGEEEDEEETEDAKKSKKDAADLRAKLDAAQAKLDARERADAKAARDALELSARAVLGKEAKFDAQDSAGKPVPMTDRAVRELVIKRLDSGTELEGRSDSYVEAAYDIAIRGAKASANPGHALAASLAGVRVDGSTETPKTVETPDVKMRRDAQDAWKKPLSFSAK